MRHGDTAKRDGHDHHQVRERRHARRFGLNALHVGLQLIHGGGVGVQPAVNFGANARTKEQEGHPKVRHEDVDNQHHGKLAVQRFGDFLQGCLVGTSANPTPSHRAQSAPKGVRGVPTQHVGVEVSHDPKRQRPAHDDAKGCREKHHDGFGSEVVDAFEVNGQAEQNQACRQQITRRHEVQRTGFPVDDAQ